MLSASTAASSSAVSEDEPELVEVVITDDETPPDETLVDCEELELETVSPPQHPVVQYLHYLYTSSLSLCVNGVSYVGQHYFVFANAIISAFAMSTFAFFQPMGVNQNAFDMSVWNSLSAGTQAHAIINWIDTFIVYTFFNSYFIENAWIGLKAALPSCCDSVSRFAGNSAILALSGFAATANAAISYAGYKPVLGELLAIVPSISTLIAITASRFVNLCHLKTMAMNCFDADLRLQESSLVRLQHLKAEWQNPVNRWLATRECNEETFVDLFSELETKGSVFDEISTSDKAADVLGYMLDIMLVAMVVLPAFLLFAQEGYEALSMVITSVQTASPLTKALLSLVPGPGLVSSLFMAINACKFRGVLQHTIEHVHYHPRDGLITVLTLLMNLWTAMAAWRFVAYGTIGPNNIFGLDDPNGVLETLYIAGNVVSCAPTTMPCMLKKIYASEEPANPEASSLDKLVHWADPERNRLSPESMTHLRRLSFFAKAPAAKDGALSELTEERASLSEPDLAQTL